jgi:hypothetical protein
MGAYKTKFHKKLNRSLVHAPLGGKPTAPNTLKVGCKVLEKLNCKYWLSAGTLLGIHRDNCLIPHDTDIDVEVLGPTNVPEVVEAMTELDLLVIRTHEDKGHIQVAFEDPTNNVIFDVYTFYEEGENLVSGYGLWYPKVHFQNLTTINFDGASFPCPDPDWYCEFRYGEGWKTPKNKKGNWMRDCKIPKLDPYKSKASKQASAYRNIRDEID